MSDVEKQKAIGGIWYSSKRFGMLSMTIEIDGVKHQFVAFKNDFQKGDQPDFRIFKRKITVTETPKP